jgi:hypothetical protein
VLLLLWLLCLRLRLLLLHLRPVHSPLQGLLPPVLLLLLL